MACLEGLEPPTYSLEGYCSIQLSYRQTCFARWCPLTICVSIRKFGLYGARIITAGLLRCANSPALVQVATPSCGYVLARGLARRGGYGKAESPTWMGWSRGCIYAARRLARGGLEELITQLGGMRCA